MNKTILRKPDASKEPVSALSNVSKIFQGALAGAGIYLLYRSIKNSGLISTHFQEPLLRKPISMEDRASAVQILRDSGLDVDRYLTEIQPSQLLESPLGPEPECLTFAALDDLANVNEGQRAHLANCTHCFEAAKTYNAIKSKALSKTAITPKLSTCR